MFLLFSCVSVSEYAGSSALWPSQPVLGKTSCQGVRAAGSSGGHPFQGIGDAQGVIFVVRPGCGRAAAPPAARGPVSGCSARRASRCSAAVGEARAPPHGAPRAAVPAFWTAARKPIGLGHGSAPVRLSVALRVLVLDVKQHQIRPAQDLFIVRPAPQPAVSRQVWMPASRHSGSASSRKSGCSSGSPPGKGHPAASAP